MKFNYFFLIFLISFQSLAFGENIPDCDHRILLLPQAHANILGGKLEVPSKDLEEIARSQFSIAKYLEQNKNIPVFSEQVSTDISVQTVSADFKKAARQIKSMFPDGLPKNFENLTESQRFEIARCGGDAISFILQNTDILHRVVENDEIQNKLFGKVISWRRQNPTAERMPLHIRMIMNMRENLALDQINNFFKANPSQKDIILIFGRDHYFSFLAHNDKFLSQCIQAPDEFKAELIKTPF